jgi:hypothetical protein
MKRDSIKLLVKSQKVPVRVENVCMPIPNAVDPTLRQSKSVVIYDYVLDERQRQVLDETSELAQRYGLSLDVVDVAAETIAKRILRRISGAINRASPTWQVGASEIERSLSPYGSGGVVYRP